MKKPANQTLYKLSVSGAKEYEAQIKKCVVAGKQLELQLKRLAKMKITPVVAKVKRK